MSISQAETSNRERGATERAFRSALEIYRLWEENKESVPADRLANREFRARHYLNSHERRWCANIIFDTIRYRRRYQWLHSQLALGGHSETFLTLHVSCLPPPQQPPSFISPVDSVSLQGALAKLSSGLSLRDHLRFGQSLSDRMADALLLILGEEAIEAAKAFNQRAPTVLRINPLVVSRRDFRSYYPELSGTKWSPWGFYAPEGVNIQTLFGYREGWFEVQEEGSQIAALMADVRPGDTVIEIGAGGGGKTLVLAALLQNRGRIFALDVHLGRLKELVRRVERAKATCVTPVFLEKSLDGEWQQRGRGWRRIEKMLGAAQCVLIDAPCNGSGVLRRSPDLRWREYSLEDFATVQRNLLLQGANFVAPGGQMVYITCAFEREQNEEVIEEFLTSHEGRSFAVEPVGSSLKMAWRRAMVLAEEEQSKKPPSFETLCSGPYMRTWPHRHGLDAFFVALLRKRIG